MIDLPALIQRYEEKVVNTSAKDGAPKLINSNADIKKVAKEMESLFAYQLLKTMRESAENMSVEKKGNGHGTYMSLFDMEVSKLFAERGLGLQDAIIQSLERAAGANEQNSNE